jgi:uncharacterized protein YcnI
MTRARQGRRQPRRWPAALAAAAVAGVALASPAAAHVSARSDAAPGASSAVVSFRVPNERTDSATIGVRVQFPRDHPLVTAVVRSRPGWTATVKRRAIAPPVVVDGEPIDQGIDEIEWKGGSIAVGEYDDFEAEVGPIPADADVLTFPTIQIYDKGDPVSWIEKPAADGRPSQRPAPSLRLAAGPAGAPAPSTGAGHEAAAVTTPAGGSDSGGDGARPLALAALLAALAALAVAVVMVVRDLRRSATAGPAPSAPAAGAATPAAGAATPAPAAATPDASGPRPAD